MKNKVSIRGKVIKKVLSIFMNFPRKVVKTGYKMSRKKQCWRVPKNYQLTKINLDGLPIEILFSDKAIHSTKLILHFHGGAFLFRYFNLYRHIAYKYAKISNAKVVSIDYHTAPYHPFPKPLEDASKVWQYLINEGYKQENIIIVGDSAGGNLALTLTMKLRDNNQALPNALVLISPWGDLKFSGKSYKYNLYKDPLFGQKKGEKKSILFIMQDFIKAYANNTDLSNPYLSPVYGSFNNFPPMLLIVGALEMLESDTITIHEKARAINTDARLLRYEGMFHDFPLLLNLIPESKHAWDEIIDFITTQFS